MPAELTQGQRKMVSVARALAARPKLLLLDEPAAGLDAQESADLGHQLREVVDQGIPMLLVDHDMGLVLGISDQLVVVESGRVIGRGTPTEIRENPRVVEAYLGATDRLGRTDRHRTRPAGERPMNAEPVLAIEGLTAGYDGAPVLRNLDLHVGAGEVVALLGPNGAGKTTTLRAISGIVRPLAGTIRLAGEDLARRSPAARARLGIAHMPEGRGVFFGLTVAEHFRLGAPGERLDTERRLRVLPRARPPRRSSCRAAVRR